MMSAAIVLSFRMWKVKPVILIPPVYFLGVFSESDSSYSS